MAAIPGQGGRERGLDLVKWLALLSMAIDHLRFLLPGHELLRWSFVPGRLAFPLFCLALAANLARARPGSSPPASGATSARWPCSPCSASRPTT